MKRFTSRLHVVHASRTWAVVVMLNSSCRNVGMQTEPPSTTTVAARALSKAGCPPVPQGVASGFETGEQLGKLRLKDCNGSDFALDELCGADATWILVVQAWCSECRETTAQSEALLATFAGNVAAVNILLENADGKAPTAADCTAWRRSRGLAHVVTLYDPLRATEVLYDEATDPLHVILDKDRVIRTKLHGSEPASISAAISSALRPR